MDATRQLNRISKFAHIGVAVVIGYLSRMPPEAQAVTVNVSPTFNYVATDGGAGGYEAFPDLTRLIDGRLMAVFYAGYTHISPPTGSVPNGGRIMYATSSDEGFTWSAPSVLHDGPVDDRDASITQLPDGRLLSTFFSYANGLSEGVFALQSSNAGATWTAPQRMAAAPYGISSPVRQLSDGRLIAGIYLGAQPSHGAVVLSDDGAATWSSPIIIPNSTGINLDAETDLIELKNGNLWAVQRSSHAPAHFSISADGGNSWSDSHSLGFVAHSPYLMRADNDVILLAYRGYNSLNGSGQAFTALRYSTDECATWSNPMVVDTAVGAYPSMVRLNDRTVRIAYYEDFAGSNIRSRVLSFVGPPLDATFEPAASLSNFGFHSGTASATNILPDANIAGGVWTNNRAAGQTSYFQYGPGTAAPLPWTENIVHGLAEVKITTFATSLPDCAIASMWSTDGYQMAVYVRQGEIVLRNWKNTGSIFTDFVIPVANQDHTYHTYGWELDRAAKTARLFFDDVQVGNSNYDVAGSGLGTNFFVGDGTAGFAHNESWERVLFAEGAYPRLGDFNGNGIVDAADYVVWRKTNSSDATAFNTWRANFGAGQTAAAYQLDPNSVAVPEPETWLMLVLAIACGATRLRRLRQDTRDWDRSSFDRNFDVGATRQGYCYLVSLLKKAQTEGC